MNLTKTEREKLTKQGWAVHTTQEMTRNSLMDYVSRLGGNWGPQVIKHYGDTREVYIVPFSAVEWLVDNKTAQGFDFTIYHDEILNQEFWVKWREGKKTAREKVRIARRGGLLRKDARMFRSHSGKK